MSSDLFRVQEHVIASQHVREYPGATAESQEDVLKLHIKQYTPLDSDPSSSDAVTIIGAHANGFPKELYEPFWDELYRRSKRFGFSVQSIWIADTTQQGMSGILNEDKLGNDPSWNDHARDLLHMTNHFRAQMPRPLIGIGHSMGGNQLVNLSLLHPRLLTTLILLDPIILSQSFNAPPTGPSFARASTFRRDLWPSRPAAAASFAKSPFYKPWDPRVLARWIQHGLRDLPTAVYPARPADTTGATPVTLTTTKHQEVWTFVRPNFQGRDADGRVVLDRTTHADANYDGTFPFYRPEPMAIFHRLPCVRPSVLYVFGETSVVSLPEIRERQLQRTGTGVGGSGGVEEGRVTEVVLEGVGHLIPMEAADRSAEAAAEWVGREMGRWREEEAGWRKGREGRGRRAQVVVDEEWVERIGGPVGRKAKL